MTEKQNKTEKENYLAARSAADGVLAGLGAGSFSYDPDGDALYRLYRDKYTALGKSAMEDTVGRASGLTGGYSNSFAVGAGNQAYADYLQKLNDVVPTLESRAYSRWKEKNGADRELYELLADAAEKAYSRYRDEIADGRYAEETAYKRSRDAEADSRAAYEYEQDLNYKYDSLLASKGYDLRTEEGRAAAERTSGIPEPATPPAALPDKADTLITKLGTYLEKGQTADAARLIAAYRAMGYTEWADKMAEIYLSGSAPEDKTPSPAIEDKTSSGAQTAGTKMPTENGNDRDNPKVPAGSEPLETPAALGALAGLLAALGTGKKGSGK